MFVVLPPCSFLFSGAVLLKIVLPTSVWSKFRADRENGHRKGSKEGKNSAPPESLRLERETPRKGVANPGRWTLDSGHQEPVSRTVFGCFIPRAFH